MSHTTQPTILLVEADPSLRRLITLGLQSRAMRIIEAFTPEHLLAVEAQQPDLLILDIDGKVHSDWSLLTTVQMHPHLSTLPIVLLAWQCPVLAGVPIASLNPPQSQLSCLPKPFDARALYTAIEQLLALRSQQEISQAREVLLVARASTPAPSIWPLVTAAGLLLAFIGFMGMLALSLLGLCIVVISLLWWTLGSSSPKTPPPLSLGLSNG